jgi:hypothetical protein
VRKHADQRRSFAALQTPVCRSNQPLVSCPMHADLWAAAATGLRGVDPARAVTPQGVLLAGTSLAGGCSDVGNKQVAAQPALKSLVVRRSTHQFLHRRHEPRAMDRWWA